MVDENLVKQCTDETGYIDWEMYDALSHDDQDDPLLDDCPDNHDDIKPPEGFKTLGEILTEMVQKKCS